MLATSVSDRVYRIRQHFSGVCLSTVELQIIVGLLRNKSLDKIACEIGITHRSLNYYCYNMMKLMGCKDLFDLLDQVRASDLCQY